LKKFWGRVKERGNIFHTTFVLLKTLKNEINAKTKIPNLKYLILNNFGGGDIQIY